MCEQQEGKKRVVLIGAGEIRASLEKDLGGAGILQADMLLALDGGLLYCLENHIRPDYIIGDFDSLPEDKLSLLETYPPEQILRLPKEKDDTDMLAAIKFAIARGGNDFVIYGGLGGRLSHTIANIQCLRYLKSLNMTGVLMDDKTKVFLLQKETCLLDEKEKGYLSVFAYSEKAEGITLKNLKYELTDAVLTHSFPLGVSNEFIGKKAEISVEEGILLIVTDR